MNTQGQFDSESIFPAESHDDMSTCSDISADVDYEFNSCKRVTKYENSAAAKPVTSTPIKSEIVIKVT